MYVSLTIFSEINLEPCSNQRRTTSAGGQDKNGPTRFSEITGLENGIRKNRPWRPRVKLDRKKAMRTTGILYAVLDEGVRFRLERLHRTSRELYITPPHSSRASMTLGARTSSVHNGANKNPYKPTGIVEPSPTGYQYIRQQRYTPRVGAGHETHRGINSRSRPDWTSFCENVIVEFSHVGRMSDRPATMNSKITTRPLARTLNLRNTQRTDLENVKKLTFTVRFYHNS